MFKSFHTYRNINISNLLGPVFGLVQGGFLVFHGFWLVSMVFQGGFIIFHGFWLVSMVFQVSFVVFGLFPCFLWFSWFLGGFHDFQGGFMVFGWFP